MMGTQVLGHKVGSGVTGLSHMNILLVHFLSLYTVLLQRVLRTSICNREQFFLVRDVIC